MEIDHLEDPGLVGKIILKLIFWIGMGDMDSIDLSQEKDRWLAGKFCNEASGYIKWGNFLKSCESTSFSKNTLLHGVSKKVPSCKRILAPICKSLFINHPAI